MVSKARHGNDWLKRVVDRQESLASKHARIKKIDQRNRKNYKLVNNPKKTFFNEFEEKIDPKYKDALHEESFLVEVEDGYVERMVPTQIYEDLASLLLQARENHGLYIVLSWPESVEWPHFSQILANKTITSDCRYEDGLKVSFYPSTQRGMSRGKDIRIDKDELIKEAREAAQNDRLCTRHSTYFALNDFDKDEKEGIRQNPCVIESTPFFELTADLKWDVVGGGYFKDVHRYMFNVTGNKRRSVIENLASQLNDPVHTKEGVFLIDASVIPKQAVISSNKPVKTDILYVDGRSKVLNPVRGGNELVQSVMTQWFKNGHQDSLVIVMDDPKAYKRNVYESLKIIKEYKKDFDRSRFKRFSFFLPDAGLVTSPEAIPTVKDKSLGKVPDFAVVGRKSYEKIARLYKIAKKIESYDKKLCRQMYRAIGFIDRLITLPISQETLRDWIRDLTENWSESETNMLAKKYLWRSYKREWIRANESSGAVASKDEFIKLCDEIELSAGAENEVFEQLINELFQSLERSDRKAIVLVKENRISEFVNELLSDRLADEDDVSVDVAVYSTELDVSTYSDVYILGLKDRELTDILFALPKGHVKTQVYISTTSAFKIENELDVILDLDPFKGIHPYIQEVKRQISPLLGSMRHMGIPIEFGTDKNYGNTYDYGYEYASFASVYLSNSQVIDVGKDTTILKFSKNEFYAVNVENIDEGDWVLPLDGFVEDVELALGRPLPREGEDSDLLKSYFQMAQKNLATKFDFKTRKEKAQKVFDLMQQIGPKLCSGVHEGMVCRWIKHIEEYSSEDELSSNSAKKKNHFMLFAKAIGIQDSLANMFWDNAIKATRVKHIQAGRGISDTLKRVLLKTMTGSELKLSDSEMDTVFSIAKQRLSRVEMILISEQFEAGQ